MESGWYPDPDDEAGRFRWFDGRTWQQATTDDPRRPAPPAGASGPDPGLAPRSWRLLGLGLLAAAVTVAVVAGWAVTRPAPSGEPPPEDEVALASPTGPVIDTRAPVFRGDPRPCPTGRPTQRDRHPDDGRVHGGNLSFPRVASFRPPAPDERYGFARDVAQQTTIVQANTDLDTPGWAAQLVVGRLARADGFDLSGRATALRVLDCTLQTAIYRSGRPVARITASETRDLGSDVYGRSGYLIAADVLIETGAGGFPGDHLVIAVTPDGEDWSFFLSAVPLGSGALAEQARRTLLALRTS